MQSIDKVLLLATRILVFLVPFIPLIVASSLFFPFITGKGFAFRILVEVMFAVWLLLALREKAFRPKRSLLLFGVASFLGIVLIADIGAENPFKAFWSNFERMEGFVTLIHLGAYFLVASSVLNAEKWWLRFFSTSVGVSAFLGIYGLLQLAGKIVINQGGVRLDGTFGNAAYFAGYMLFHIFLTLFLLSRHRIVPHLRWLYVGALILQTVTLYYTATRGAGIGLVGGLLLTMLLVAFGERERKDLRGIATGVLLFLVLIVGTLYMQRESAFVKNNPTLRRFTSISLESAAPRLMVWGMAWEGFQERPILGWGQEGFNYVFNKYYDPDMWTQEQWFDRTHNIFFDWLIAAGILGLLSYLALFGFLFRYLWTGHTTDGSNHFLFTEKAILTGLLVSYMTHNFFVFDNLISYLLFFSLLAFVHTRYSKPFPVLEKSPALHDEQTLSIAGATLLVALVAGIYFLNVRPITVSQHLISAIKQNPKGITENLSFYRKAFLIETVGTQEVAEQSIQAAASVSVAQNVPSTLKEEFLAFAKEAMNREIARAPNDTRLRMFVGGLNNRLGRYAEALPHLEKAHELSPTKQTVAFELANTYLNTKRQADALAMLKQAFESAPLFEGARIAYVASAIYSKEFKLADELLASTTEMSTLTDERLVRAYFENKQFPKVIALLKLRLAKNPNDPQTHISLAAAYLSNGNRAESIRELETVIGLDPNFKKQGEYYISEIKAGRNP